MRLFNNLRSEIGRRSVITGFLTLFLALPAAFPAQAQNYDTRAQSAYVLDLTTGTVLLEKNADIPLPPASMSKLMTINMLFEALQDGRVTMDTVFSVSTRAKNMGGSTMFLNETDRPTVGELIQGIIVLSGNDACVVVAEGLAGTEEAFARLMNDRAKALGMNNSTFENASGWPAPNQRMSMRDLGSLGQRLITEFPEYYHFFAQTEFGYDGRAPDNRFNRNPLLKLNIGADGLKTGHTSEAGYGLIGSALQGDRRVVFVISGLNSEKERAEEAEQVVNWAFRQFVLKTLAKKDEIMATAPVWMGSTQTVDLIAPEDLQILFPALAQGEIQAEVVFNSPIQAPVTAGDALAELVLTLPDMPQTRLPLVAKQDVLEGGFLPRLRSSFSILFNRFTGDTLGLSI
ncbi:D-alanyl-D-alanine carboxypeptidase family protein [Falsihalocynthiibacter arcticus]|uniref:D-alanyl-D-alanine carboxypeptidase family protein n=1 Tax=Falsihalocynthiibacter arcticus TaxID=1579316 RepID=UPI0009EED90C|nr:D-alanyl-D-alanine carboxypeptidase family protein [Falsihalocynthiibacter arcticus]